jgi:hypothetical protein|tara:strand:- start:815 stop:1075 length:261 start_codon:yes stop_codon:yes gene_type:complete
LFVLYVQYIPKGKNMSDTNLPPGPYSYETTAPLDEHHGKGHVYIVDATGKRIGVVWGKPDVKMSLAYFVMSARNNSNDIEEILPWR